MALLIRESSSAGSISTPRPQVRGKFLYLGDEKLFVRGVTYGTFGQNSRGEAYPEQDEVANDFSSMASSEINAVRTYTPAPRWLLDEAQRHGLLVMCGLPWEQHVAFLNDSGRSADIVRRVREAVREVAGHPALLGFTVGNEIPGDIVRWYGRGRIERFLHRLVDGVREEDPEALVTYVNFPTTEYLELPFVDFCCYNVYLEDRERLEAYLARLQHLAADKPLVMAEVGFDSRRHGADRQAEVVSWQVEATFEAGAAGCFVFAWTDEWHRGGAEIDDWDFGLVDRQRRPKPALYAVKDAYRTVPFGDDILWPQMTVAICSYNGSRTLSDALDGVMDLDYPHYEVIVVNDGSTDTTAEIAAAYPVRVISTSNRGLSAARNVAWENADGEIVAYIDDDARPDRHWLKYLAQAIRRHDAAGAGGPNLPPPGDGLVAECVSMAPGGPNHVLLDDVVAEHIPGCNMAFRRSVLEEVGGFDPRFRAAGDDVDICWRVQDAGHKIVFGPAAMVWHHRRSTITKYWKQQTGYGKAEALLERKWPQKYNAAGHARWVGRLYGRERGIPPLGAKRRIYHGTWGSAPFQRLYHGVSKRNVWIDLPESRLLLAPALALALAGVVWSPLQWAWLAVAFMLGIFCVGPVRSALAATFHEPDVPVLVGVRRRAVLGWLHFLWPFARLRGRLRYGLSPWRISVGMRWQWPRPNHFGVWSERWLPRALWLERCAEELRSAGVRVNNGSEFDEWDLEICAGIHGSTRIATMLEEHGQGRQMWRIRAVPHVARWVIVLSFGVMGLGVALLARGETALFAAFAVVAALITARAGYDVGVSMGAVDRAVRKLATELGTARVDDA